MKKYYRSPWTKESVEYLTKWWPHWGACRLSEILNLTKRQVSCKASKLHLKLPAKVKRLCVECAQGYQFSRSGGLRCHPCYCAKRKKYRKGQKKPLKGFIKELLRTLRLRNKRKYGLQDGGNLTTGYLIRLWKKQSGLCYYSGYKMQLPVHGSGRNPDSASLDRKCSMKGYVKGNVVWCTWVCNVGKWSMSEEEYIKRCAAVVKHYEKRSKLIHVTTS